MSYPNNRTTFKSWVKEQAHENKYGTVVSSDGTLETIIDSVIAEYSAVNPLISLANLEVSNRYVILPDDWVDEYPLNTAILYALQRGQDPSFIDIEQSGYECFGSQQFFSSNKYRGNGYGLGTGSSVMQSPFSPNTPKQFMPTSSCASINNVQKKVFVLPNRLFSTGQLFEIRYGALHKIQDAATGIIAMMTIPKIHLAEIFDRIFARAIKSKIFFALKVNEVAEQDKLDLTRLDKLAGYNPFTSKY